MEKRGGGEGSAESGPACSVHSPTAPAPAVAVVVHDVSNEARSDTDVKVARRGEAIHQRDTFRANEQTERFRSFNAGGTEHANDSALALESAVVVGHKMDVFEEQEQHLQGGRRGQHVQERPVACKACEEPGAGLDEAPDDPRDDLCV